MNDEIKSWKTGKEHISFSEVADWLNKQEEASCKR